MNTPKYIIINNKIAYIFVTQSRCVLFYLNWIIGTNYWRFSFTATF